MTFPSKLASPFLRRVVVTGIGAVTPLGGTFTSTWQAVLSPQEKENKNDSVDKRTPKPAPVYRGITSLEDALAEQGLPETELSRELDAARKLPCQVAAAVPGVEADTRKTRTQQFALLAAEEAARQADLLLWLGLEGYENENDYSISETSEREAMTYLNRRERVGVFIGNGMSSVREFTRSSQFFLPGGQGARRLNPHFVPKVLPNSATGHIALRYRLGGPNHCASTACAAGAHSIGDAMRCIQHGDADIILAGGAESSIDPLSMAGFCRLRALSSGFNDEPSLASRPFDSRRDGFVMAEGAAVLVLEELGHAQSRNAPILCELAGYGLTGDGYHVTSPDPDGSGEVRAMRIALERAGIHCGEVDYVNAHATSTPIGDGIEAKAIQKTLMEQGSSGRSLGDLVVSSTKGATGHLLGATGALEAAFAVMSISDGKVPPTKNLNVNSIDFDVGYHLVSRSFIEGDVRVSISNSFGFYGTNASLVFVAYDAR